MVTRFRKPLTTLLSKANKPLSDKERMQLGGGMGRTDTR